MPLTHLWVESRLAKIGYYKYLLYTSRQCQVISILMRISMRTIDKIRTGVIRFPKVLCFNRY
jgi:hypothetical protein